MNYDIINELPVITQPPEIDQRTETVPFIKAERRRFEYGYYNKGCKQYHSWTKKEYKRENISPTHQSFIILKKTAFSQIIPLFYQDKYRFILSLQDAYIVFMQKTEIINILLNDW